MKKLGWFNTTLRRRIAAGLVALLTVTTVVPSFSAGDEIHLINDLGGYGGGLSAEEEAERDWNEDLVSVAKSAWLDAHSGEDRERNEASPSVLAYTEEIPATGSELNRGETAPAYSNAYDVFADFDESAAAGAVSSYLKKARKEEKAKSGDFLHSMLKEAVIPEAGVPRDNDLKKEILALQKMNDDDYEVFHMGGTYRPVSGDILFVAGHISTGEESPASASNISKGSSEGIVHMAVPQVQDAVLAMEEAASVQIPVYGASISEATPSEMEQTIVSDTNPAESDEALLAIVDAPQEPEVPAVAETDVVLAEDMNQAEEANSNHIKNDSENHSQEVSEEQIQEIIAEEEAKALKRNAKNAVLAGIVIAGPEENGSDKITFLYSTAKGNVEIGVISANEPRIIGCADMEELHDKYCGILEELEEEAEEAEISEEETPEAPLEETEKIPNEKTEYVWKKGNLTVTATLTDPDAVPDDAELVVTPVTKSTKGYNYQAYMDALSGEIASSNENNTVLYDVAFLADEKDEHGEKTGRTIELQPEDDKVKVNFRFSSAELTDEIGAEYAEKVRVIHLPLVPEVKESADTTKDATDIAARDIVPEVMDPQVSVGTKSSNIEFTAEDFSVFAIVYTVDFEYVIDGKTYYFSMEGGTSMQLSDLIVKLGIASEEEAAAFVKEKVENVEFSDESLVKVTHTADDWTLESLAPFTSEETLTIEMKDGEKVVVKVKDAQETTSPWDLANVDNTKWLHVSVDSSVIENEQERDAVFKLNFSYELEEAVVRAIDAYSGNPVLVYDLSSLIADSPLEIQNSVVDITQGNRKLGTCTFKDGVAILEFTDPSFFNGKTSFTGWFSLTAQTNETELGTNNEWTYGFPGTGDTITIHYKKTVEDGTKSVYSTQDADGNYILHYTANINVNSDLNSMVFMDTLSGLQTLDATSVKMNGTPVTVTQTSNGFNFNVGTALGTSRIEKGSYRVTYDTKVTKEQLEAMTADKTTETNKADWTVNGDKVVPGGETTIEINKPVPPIPVEKSSNSSGTNQPGETVTYTVTYGDENTELSGFRISDRMTDVVIPQGQVSISYNGQSENINFTNQSKDNNYSKSMVTLYDYTFPQGTAGKGPVTVTYTVQLIATETAKANGVYDTTAVINTAQEHRQNTTDSERTTVIYEKEPTYTVDKAASSSQTDSEGHWLPGSVITYTLTIGDENTNMAGVNIKDVMTDLQILQGDILIQFGNGAQTKLSDYVANAITWNDDGKYSTNDVELFNFIMPSNAGNGPVVITYHTKVISQEQATANNIFGDVNIKNTGTGGKQSDTTTGIGPFNPYPIEKTVFQSDTDVNGKQVNMGSTVHYVLTFGDSSMNMGGVTIYDEMTDLQKLTGNIIVKKADGTSYNMPVGSGQWAEDGVVWNYFDDGKYSTGNVRVFNYKLPADIGTGPLTVEYDAQIITEEEANEAGIKDAQNVYNTFRIGNHQAQTEVEVPFPVDPKHEAQVSKEFSGDWDLDTNTLYWDIVVEKTSDSAYPIENVTVREFWDENGIVIKNESIGVYYTAVTSADDFDLINAVVTTDDGTVLTPGIDYNINKTSGSFTFTVLTERVHIRLPFHSPVQISNGFTMHNVVQLNNKRGEADATYTNPNVEIIKNGTYSENSRILAWEVQLNPSAVAFPDSDPLKVMFTDAIPQGLTLLNFSDFTENNPSLSVTFPGKGYSHFVPVTVDENNVIIPVDIAAHNAWGSQEFGLNGNKIVINYWTRISDEEWNRITSSGSGSKTYENTVTITAGDGQEFSAKDSVTVTSDEYLAKYDTTQENDNGVVIDTNSNTSKKISYRIDINPHGYKLNNGNALTLTDYISTNMDLDTASVKLYKATMGDDGKLIAGDEVNTKDIVSYNDDSRLLALREVKDETPMVLEYVCIARAQGEDTFTNTATLIGGGSHSSTTAEKHNIQTNDAGVKVDGLTMSLHKIDENDISVDLANAKFQLYECKLAIGDLTNSDTYNAQWWTDLLNLVNKRTAGNATPEEINQINEQFRIVDYEAIDGPVTTEEKGYVQWDHLSEHKLYAWKEVEAPENYTGTDEYHYFVGYQHIDENSGLPQPLLPEEEQLKRKQAAWALDDACQFANGIRVASMANLTTWTATNIRHPYTAISVTKVWEGDSDNLFETRPKDGIRLQLVQIDSNGNRENYGSPVAINADSSGYWPSHIWNRLLLEDDQGNPYKYTVVEERVDGYSTTYSDGGEGQSSGTITVTNKMIPKSTDIHVKKVFDGIGEEDTLPTQIHVSLMKIRTDMEGNASEPMEVRDVMLTASNNWEHVFDKLDTKEVVDEVAYNLTYTVVEDTTALKQQGFDYEVTYSDNGAGVIEASADNPLIITNKPKGIPYDLNVSKTFTGVILPDESYSAQFTLTQVDGWDSESPVTTKLAVPKTVSTNDGIEKPVPDNQITIPFGSDLSFTSADLNKDFYFMIEELVPEAAKTSPYIADGVQYPSNTKRWVKLHITKDENGELIIERYFDSDRDNAVPEDREIGFVNERLCRLQIEKVFAGSAASSLTDDQKKSLSFTINGSGYNETFSYGVDVPEKYATWSDGKLTVQNLRIGNYTVTESTAEGTVIPYTHTVQYQVGETITSDKAPITVTASKENTVTITNTYESGSVVLPLTGGPGTRWFHIIGLLILASAAGLYAYTRRRKFKTILAARKGNASTSQRGGGGLL